MGPQVRNPSKTDRRKLETLSTQDIISYIQVDPEEGGRCLGIAEGLSSKAEVYINNAPTPLLASI
jgi:hypothetical protein